MSDPLVPAALLAVHALVGAKQPSPQCRAEHGTDSDPRTGHDTNTATDSEHRAE
jgi:hypothetical protein